MKRLPDWAQRFLLEGVLLRVVAVFVALSAAIIVPLVMCIAMVIAIFDPLRAIDLVGRTGEEMTK